MEKKFELDQLIEVLPELGFRVWSEEIAGPEALNALVAEAGLPEIRFRDGRPYGHWSIEVVEPDDEAAAERRLRSAITRRVGKPAGGDKHWDLGSFELSLSLSGDELYLSVRAQYSLAEMRRAADDWLNGMDGKTWLLTHGFLDDPDAVADERGLLPNPAGVTNHPMSRLSDDGHARTSFYHDASARPPGVKAASDDEAYALAIEYFCETLGELDDANMLNSRPSWTRGDRVFKYHRMRSRSRSVEYREL